MTNVTIKGVSAKGRKELKMHLEGKKLTLKQALLAKCYDCMAGYADGKVDCGIPDCPNYAYMPYGKSWKNRPVSEAMKKRGQKIRENISKQPEAL